MNKILTLIFTLILTSIALVAMCEEVNYDKNILKRTPTIDGKIQQGEWDIFYSYNTEKDEVTTYANWDTNNLYFAVSCNILKEVAITFDINADGWTIGDDNYLLIKDENNSLNLLKAVRTTEEGVTLVAVEIPETTPIVTESSVVNGKSNFEMAIPCSICGISSITMDKTNFNIAVKTEENDWYPFNPNDLKDNTVGNKLVNHKAFALDPLDIEFYVTRDKIVAGDTLDGKVKIKNRGKEPVVVKEIIMAGEGLGEDVVDSYKIKVGEIRPGRTFEREYHSKILPDTQVGAKVLGCEIYNDQMKLGGALRSFEVIKPCVFKPFLGKEVFYTNDKVIRIGVRVISYSDKKYATGTATAMPPEGWEVSGSNKNKFNFCGYNKYTDIIFRLTPPLGAVGTYKIPIVITTGDGQETVTCNFQIIQTK